MQDHDTPTTFPKPRGCTGDCEQGKLCDCAELNNAEDAALLVLAVFVALLMAFISILYFIHTLLS